MCGIIGSFNFEINKEILNSIIHRGPDDHGIYNDKKINLGHTRLSIQDLSKNGYQPMRSQCQNYVLVYNGEIYNKNELQKLINSNGIFLKGDSDTEVLLNLFLLYREECLNYLNGIFSFAIWNIKDETLFIARDFYGVKPLYFIEKNNQFHFSSELKALIYLSKLTSEINYESLLNYFTYLWVPGPDTLFKNFSKLEAGHYIIVKNSKIVLKKQYYDLLKNKQLKRNYNFKEIKYNTKKLIEEAVKKQLISDVKVGSFLSGGIDSTVITTLASKYCDKSFEAFTILNKDFKNNSEREFADDYKYAKIVASNLGIKLNTLEVNHETLIKEINEMTKFSDEPTSDPSAINTMLISKSARSAGFKVLLSGIGGDDIFSGYRRHSALYYEKYWKWTPELLKLILNKTLSKIKTQNNFVRRFKKIFEYSHLKNNESINSYFYWLNPELIKSTLKNKDFDFKDYQKNLTILKDLDQLDNNHVNISKLSKMLYLELKYFLGDHNLNYTDKVAMHSGVEVRVPFLDKDLVNYVSSLEDKYKIQSFQNKWLLKKSMKNIIPSEIINRKKIGFGLPIRSWVKNELNETINDTINSSNSIIKNYIDKKQFINLINMNHSGIIDSSYFIFNIFCLELWFRNFNSNTVFK